MAMCLDKVGLRYLEHSLVEKKMDARELSMVKEIANPIKKSASCMSSLIFDDCIDDCAPTDPVMRQSVPGRNVAGGDVDLYGDRVCPTCGVWDCTTEKQLAIIGEPFKIKTIERIRMTTKGERIQALERAKYNPLLLDAEMIAVDLLTDSGVGAQSNYQWAGLMTGDESYAGSRSFKRLESTVQRITGFPYVVPAHQGRGAENLLYRALLENKKESVVLGNGFFGTTKNIINSLECNPVIISVPGDMENGGNIDCGQLEDWLKRDDSKVSCVLMIIPNNVMFDQPASMLNIQMASMICRHYKIPLVADACRFIENAWHIKRRESGFAEKSVREVVLEMLSHFDAITVSAKKNGLSNSGGFICIKDDELYTKARRKCMMYEGHFTYGGMSGRDMEAVATGLDEFLDETYLQYRFDSLKTFSGLLKDVGVPGVKASSSAVYVDACKCLPHFAMVMQPSFSLICALYIEGGVRGWCSITDQDRTEDYIKFAVPHRLYTISHFKYVARVFEWVLQSASRISGLRVTYLPDFPQTFYEAELELVEI